MRSVVLPDATTVEYMHNANNQRVAKKVNGVITEKYLWANLTTLLAIYDKDNNLLMRFNYANGRMPVSMTKAENTYYLAYSHVGTLRAVMSKDGTIVKQIAYDGFGNVLLDSKASFHVPFGFAGGLYDPDTKLTRFGYRDYDAATGKWTAKDPIGFNGGDTNLYGYVLGDPVNWIDPEGLLALCQTGQGEAFGYHQFWKGENQSVGFYPAEPTTFWPFPAAFSYSGTYLNPDPHTDDDDLMCQEIPDDPLHDCIEKCLFQYNSSTPAPYYSVYGNQCRKETMNMYNKCLNDCLNQGGN